MRKIPRLTGGRTGEGSGSRGLRKKGRKVMGGRVVKTTEKQRFTQKKGRADCLLKVLEAVPLWKVRVICILMD